MSQSIVQKACLHSVGLVVPVKHNKYRPYLLRHPVLATLSFLLIATKVATIGIFALTPETAYLSTITSPFLIELTNNARRDASIPSLTPNGLLQRSAQKKGEDMLKNDYFAHTSPAGATPWKWFDVAGYDYVYAGENLAIDFSTAEGVHEAWMNSPGHRANILNPRYRDIGIAVVSGEFQGRTTTIIVQHFGSLTTEISKAPTATLPINTATPGPVDKLIKPQPTKTPAIIPPASAINTPLPIPEILEPTEGQLLPSGAATVRGKSADGTTVELALDGKKAGSYFTANGIFSGNFKLPGEIQKEAKLTVFARMEDRVSKLSPERHVKIDTRGPSISPDSAILLPDPNGDVTSIMLVIPIFGATKSASVIIDGKETPLSVTGSVATGKISTASSTSRFTVRAEDSYGRVKSSVVSPLQKYQISPPTAEEKTAQAKINAFAERARELSIMLVYVLALLLAVNILIHIRIQHLDLIIHALLVIAMITLLFLIT
ncbi:MAG: CAP domain-containing protein [bacterium]|nr:CAP domain-containing protein [bacterium]